MELLLLEMVQKYPIGSQVLAVIAVARVMFKPVMTLVQSYVDATPSLTDNEKWEAVKASSVYKSVAWAVDYLLSIKLPAAK